MFLSLYHSTKFLITYYVPHTVLGCANSKISKIQSLRIFESIQERQIRKKINALKCMSVCVLTFEFPVLVPNRRMEKISFWQKFRSKPSQQVGREVKCSNFIIRGLNPWKYMFTSLLLFKLPSFSGTWEFLCEENNKSWLSNTILNYIHRDWWWQQWI